MPNFYIVEKDGEKLIVHPTTLAAHEAAGWKLVGESDNDGAKPAKKSKEKPEEPAGDVPEGK